MIYKNKKNKTKKVKKVNTKKYNYRKVKKVYQVKKVVNSILSRKLETFKDTYSWILTPLCLQNTIGNLGNNVVVLNPSNATINGWSIGLGNESNDMRGSKITLKSASVRYIMTMEPYNNVINQLNGKPCIVRMYIFRNKKIPQNDLAVTNICGNGVNANFFEAGNSDIGFIGNVEDYIQKINSERYNLLATKTFKIGNAVQPNTTIGVGSPIYAQSNNDFKMCIFGSFDVTKYLKKTVNRDDDGVFVDDYTFCLFQYVYADGTTAGNAQAPIRIKFEIEYKYTDA